MGTDLAAVIATGDLGGLVDAIAAGADIAQAVAQPDLHGRGLTYPVILAAGLGEVEMVRALLDAGADPDPDPEGPSPSALRAAVEGTSGRRGDGDHASVVSLLLARGLRVETTPGRDLRLELLYRVLSNPSPDLYAVLDLLLQASGTDCAEEPLLVVVARRGSGRRIVELLIGHGASPDTRRADGSPVLVIAARHDHLSVVDTLLAAGAEPDLEDAAGWTALMHAADLGRRSVVASLRLAGADVEHRAPDGADALDLAGYWGRQSVQRALGAHSIVPRPVELRSSALVFSPRTWQLSGPPASFERLALLLKHALDSLGNEYSSVVGSSVEEGCALVERLRTQPVALTRPPGAVTLRLTGSAVDLLRLSLAQYALPELEPPSGYSQTEIDDLYGFVAGAVRKH